MTPSAVHRAALWMGGTLLSFSVVAVALRDVPPDIGTMEILFFRSLTGLAVMVLAAAARGRRGLRDLRSGQPGWTLFRNVMHFGGSWGWAAGIRMLPLATVFALEFTVPVWAALIAVLFLGERLNPGRVAALVLGSPASWSSSVRGWRCWSRGPSWCCSPPPATPQPTSPPSA